MPTLRLPLTFAKHLARSLSPHTDKFSPPLSGIHVPAGESQFAYATDRFTVGRYDMTNVATIWPDVDMTIPVDLLKFIPTLGKSTLGGGDPDYEVQIEARNNALTPALREVTLSIYHRVNLPEGDEYELAYFRVWRTSITDAKFPPVSRLFETFLPGEENRAVLQPIYVEKFTGYAKATRGQIRITMPEKKKPDGRLNPLLIEVGTRFKGLMMGGIEGSGDFGTDLAMDNAARDTAAKAEAESKSTDE